MTNSYENKAKARNVLNKVGYIISSFIQLIVNGVYYLFIIVSLITGCAIILLSTPFNILYFIGGVVEFIYKDETDIKRKELLKISYHDYYGRNGNNAFDSYFSYTTYNEHIYYVENGLPYYDKVL